MQVAKGRKDIEEISEYPRVVLFNHFLMKTNAPV
jgi:hypothetical protein